MTHALKKATIATAFVALTGSALGSGAAGATELSTDGPLGSSSSELLQLSSTLFDNADSADSGKDSSDGNDLVEKVDVVEGLKEPLSADEATKVLDGSFVAKVNENITIGFQPDGTVGYSDGCNGGSGTYAVTGDSGAVVFDNLVSTKMACAPAVMEDARAFMDVLASTPKVYAVDESTIALGSQGHVIEFIKQAAE